MLSTDLKDFDWCAPLSASLPNLVRCCIALLIFAPPFIVHLRQYYAPQSRFILTGLPTAGKTCIFRRLVWNTFRHTLPTQGKKEGRYKTAHSQMILIDTSGDRAVREECFHACKRQLTGIIFVIDSVTVVTNIRELAEALYVMLVDRATVGFPIAILCTKRDADGARTAADIKMLLEKEVDMLRRTKFRKTFTPVILGNGSERFEFVQLTQRVTFLDCSAMRNELKGLRDWFEVVSTAIQKFQ